MFPPPVPQEVLAIPQRDTARERYGFEPGVTFWSFPRSQSGFGYRTESGTVYLGRDRFLRQECGTPGSQGTNTALLIAVRAPRAPAHGDLAPAVLPCTAPPRAQHPPGALRTD